MKEIAFLVYPEITLLDLVGPLQPIKMLEATGAYRVVTVGERIEPVATDTGLSVVPERTYAEVPNPFALIVPGGRIGPIKAMLDDALMNYVRSASEAATIVGSVCTGSLILAAAGLLEGRRATTHWMFHEMLAKLGATPVQERWVEDGRFITSAGVSAGIDMALALAARLTDETTARTIQLFLEYDPEPPFGHIDRASVNHALVDGMAASTARETREILAAKPELVARLAS
jgi:transcriptional regulator GlxA family with amidase domain